MALKFSVKGSGMVIACSSSIGRILVFVREKAIQPQKVLIVDDDYLIRWALAHALSEAGYEVSTAEDGLKALEMAEKEYFDFVVTDLIMPGLDGWKLMEMLCCLPAPPLVIAMSAHADEDYPGKVKERGGWAYVEKSSLIDGVRETLRKAAAQ